MRDVLEHARLMDQAIDAAIATIDGESFTGANLHGCFDDMERTIRTAVYDALDVLAASDAVGEPKTSGEVSGSPKTTSSSDGAYRGGGGETAG